MTKSHVLGFPRLGPDREYKKAVEAYWNGKINQNELLQKGASIRKNNWLTQKDAGLDYVTVGDFAWYDHILDLSVMLSVIPSRFTTDNEAVDLDTMFRMARGRAPQGKDAPACEMTKWFNTNYHYLVPEFSQNQQFTLGDYCPVLNHIDEAQQHGHQVKASIVGPLSFLWLGKCADTEFDKLSLLSDLCNAYSQVLGQMKSKGVEWVQIDEPVLALDLPQEWRDAYATAYNLISKDSPKIILSTYFGDLAENFSAIANLPVAGLHLDTTRAKNWQESAKQWDKSKVLSLGVINGRDVWQSDLQAKQQLLEKVQKEIAPAELWVGSSCSLLHTPVDLDSETKLDDELKQWLAFAKQKCREVAVLGKALNGNINDSEQQEIDANAKAAQARKTSTRIHKEEVAKRVSSITPQMMERDSAFPQRSAAQKEHIKLPSFPTTTIGSFPQTAEIRSLRGKFKRGAIDEAGYTEAMRKEIATMVAKQEEIGLDVLVHGEPERNDMVEYFGELLDGIAVTS
ncbi:MAG: 5-methyltetrahydropteroyltriglutamate--homocysteine S-methyltransferase, partial [Candidatus Portiera sp.]|nr:5-methyltetrahydropteroyltriglutamate--homocysteine S-methyltransferase [Portiera sp.]